MALASCRVEEPRDVVSAGPAPTADSLYQKAELLKAALKYDSAALLFRAAAREYEEQENWEKYIASQGLIAFCLWITHRSAEAIELSLRMIEESGQKLGPAHIEIARLYTVLGNIHADRRTREDFDKCVAYYEKALEITRTFYGEQHPALADAYERLGIARYLADDYAAAIPFYEKALTFLEGPTPENAGAYAKIHNNLGLIYFGMGHLPKAIENFRKARYFIREVLGREDSRVAKFSVNIAEALIQMGDFEEALILLEEAWALDAEVGEPGSKIKAYLLNSLGDGYQAKGDYHKAVAYYRQCLEYWDPNKRDDANGLILEFSKIGECHLKLGQTEQALHYFKKANALLDAFYDSDNLARVNALANLGRAWEQRGNPHLAETYFLQALSIARQKVGENHPASGKLYLELARHYLREGALEKALSQVLCAEAAFQLGTGVSVEFPATERLSSLSDYIAVQELAGLIHTRYYERSGKMADLDQARAAFRKGLAYSDSLKTTLQSGPALQKAQLQAYSLAEKALDCYGLIWQATREESYLHESFIFFEKSKSDWLRSSAREWLAREYAGIPKELVERELLLKSQLAYYQKLKKEQSLAALEGSTPQAGAWQEGLFRVKKELDLLLKELEEGYPEYYRLKYDYRTVSLEEVQKFARLNEAELITYFWGGNAVYALSVTSGGLHWEQIPVDCIEDQLSVFHQAINEGNALWQPDSLRKAGFQAFCTSAGTLYTSLVEPLLPGKSEKRLILVPDGPLGRLPFQALLDSAPGEQAARRLDYRRLPYLLRSRPVQYAYSAGLLLQQNRPRSGEGYIGFSPSFEVDPAVATLTRGDSLHLARLYPGRMSRDGWGGLMHNQEETEAVIAMIGGKNFAGAAATEHNFKRAAPQAKILHLATHAFTHDTEPGNSALVFARDPERPEDGQLYAYELYHLPLQAELAVLSACNTGAGVLQRGEGVMSLSRAFKYAGCPSVVMSLWPANDAAAKEVIVGFFEHLKQKSSKSEALRRATLGFLSDVKNDGLAHPFYWANFVAIGKDDPILLETGGALPVGGLVIMAALFAMAGLVFLYRKKGFILLR